MNLPGSIAVIVICLIIVVALLCKTSIRQALLLALRVNRIFLFIVVVVLIMPLIVGAVYALPLPIVMSIDSNSVLSYYAIAFGLVGASFAYFNEARRRDAAKKRPAIPYFTLSVKKHGSGYEMKLMNCGDKEWNNLYLYDTPIKEAIHFQPHYETAFEAIYMKQSERFKLGVNHYYVPDWFDVIDGSGYPSYVQIIAFDSDDTAWACDFVRKGNRAPYSYVPNVYEI